MIPTEEKRMFNHRKKPIDDLYTGTQCWYCLSAIDHYEGDHGYTHDTHGYICKLRPTAFGQESCTKIDELICPLFQAPGIIR